VFQTEQDALVSEVLSVGVRKTATA